VSHLFRLVYLHQFVGDMTPGENVEDYGKKSLAEVRHDVRRLLRHYGQQNLRQGCPVPSLWREGMLSVVVWVVRGFGG